MPQKFLDRLYLLSSSVFLFDRTRRVFCRGFCGLIICVCGALFLPFFLNHSTHCLIYILHLQSNLVDNLVFCSSTDWLVKADANVLLSFSVFPFSISSAIKLGFDCMWHVLLLLFFSLQTCTCHWHCSIALGHFFWPSIQTL